MHISIGFEEHDFHPMVDLLFLEVMIKLLNYGTGQAKNVFTHSTSIVGKENLAINNYHLTKNFTNVVEINVNFWLEIL